MKALFALAFILVGYSSSLVADVPVAPVCFYKDINYGGAKYCLYSGNYINNLGAAGFDRAISSVSIDGTFEVELFSDFNLSGSKVTLNVSHPDLRSQNFNDVARSARVNVPAGRICFFQNDNYTGAVKCLNPGFEIKDLAASGWNDTISSVQVFGDASVYVWENTQFGGQKLWIRSSTPSLNRTNPGWNDRISSARAVHASGQ